MTVTDMTGSLLTITENGFGKRSPIDEYRFTHRGSHGVRTIVTNERNGNVVFVSQVTDDNELIITTEQGMTVRIPVKDIREQGRNTQGVRIMRLNDSDKVVSVTKTISVSENGTPCASGENGLPPSPQPAVITPPGIRVEPQPRAEPAREPSEEAEEAPPKRQPVRRRTKKKRAALKAAPKKKASKTVLVKPKPKTRKKPTKKPVRVTAKPKPKPKVTKKRIRPGAKKKAKAVAKKKAKMARAKKKIVVKKAKKKR